jgi:hypothetical protein
MFLWRWTFGHIKRRRFELPIRLQRRRSTDRRQMASPRSVPSLVVRSM